MEGTEILDWGRRQWGGGGGGGGGGVTTPNATLSLHYL